MNMLLKKRGAVNFREFIEFGIKKNTFFFLSSVGKSSDQKNRTDPHPISPSVCHIQHMVLIISPTQPLNVCEINTNCAQWETI
jgi:hypothetical protein